jgi:hypothetical protein
MSDASKAVRFLRSLQIPEGPLAGRPMKVAPFQRSFVEGALAPETSVAVLSIGRGNAKTALSAGVALGSLLGEWDRQPRREVLIAARPRDQARIAWDFAAGFAGSLLEEVQKRLTFRRSPRLEIEFEDDRGSHFLRALAADGKSALGSAPRLVLMDERGHWPRGAATISSRRCRRGSASAARGPSSSRPWRPTCASLLAVDRRGAARQGGIRASAGAAASGRRPRLAVDRQSGREARHRRFGRLVAGDGTARDRARRLGADGFPALQPQ